MIGTYLAIEQDDAVHERESLFWKSRNFSSVRAYSMNEGIEIASKSQFVFIGINSDNIPFDPILRVLRDATPDPIFISTTKYDMRDAGVAYGLGADLYGQIGGEPGHNYSALMQKITSLHTRPKMRKSIKHIIFDDILYSFEYHMVFVCGFELKLAKAELDIIKHMLENPRRALTHDHICRAFLDGDNSPDSVYATMKRLRKKIRDLSGFDYIEATRDLGYRLVTRKNKNR